MNCIVHNLLWIIKKGCDKMNKDVEKYRFNMTDSNDKKWYVSLKWLKHTLSLPDSNWYHNVYSMGWKISILEKTVNFLRELHEPKIIGYFYFKLFQLVKDREKQFHASFILDKVESFGLHEERIKAWDNLIEDGAIIKGSAGWYKRGILTSKKIKVVEHIKRMGSQNDH
ncbi:hypothetical protein ES702_03926 [subsurface metagenome]